MPARVESKQDKRKRLTRLGAEIAVDNQRADIISAMKVCPECVSEVHRCLTNLVCPAREFIVYLGYSCAKGFGSANVPQAGCG